MPRPRLTRRLRNYSCLSRDPALAARGEHTFLSGTFPGEREQRRPLEGAEGTAGHRARNAASPHRVLTYCCFLSDSNLVISSLSLSISVSS